MASILTTERLAFVPFTPADLDLVIELHGDPAVTRFLSDDGKPFPVSLSEQKLAGWIADQARLGVSKWKAVRRTDGAFVGRAGFSVFPETGELEMGFTFKRSEWGKGYATEAAAALIDWLARFKPAGHDRAIAFAHVDNLGSRRVLEKIGLRPTGVRPVNGIHCAFYETRAV